MMSIITSCCFFFVILSRLSWVYGFDQFNIDCLKAHNKVRRLHGVPDLVLDQSLINFAQNWANKLASENIFDHRPDNAYGENLYADWETKVTGDKPVDLWYSEIKDYNYANPGFSMETGHFTQVVWAGTQKVGCALARGSQYTYIVANYDPPGNYPGEFVKNVPRKVK